MNVGGRFGWTLLLLCLDGETSPRGGVIPVEFALHDGAPAV